MANGLNQLTSIGGVATSHDSKGNLTGDPVTGKTYGYSSENLLKSATGGVTLAYDPAMRLYEVAGASTTRFAYDGIDMIAEYNSANALQRRFVFGPAVDEPLVQYEGPGTTDRRWFHADERGSVVAISDASGNMLNINTYDEFGKPGASNQGRFQYTGQKWITELGLYDYKARMYDPLSGRFPQADPIGYEGGINLYAYVGNDPINFVDPTGMELAKWLWDCYGNCGGPDNGYWNGGVAGLGTSTQRLEAAGWTQVEGGWLAPKPKGGCGAPQGGEVLVCGSLRDSGLFHNAGIERQPLSNYHYATPSWWNAYEGIDPDLKALESNIQLIMSGLAESKASVPAKQYDLPGGKNAFYQRYGTYGIKQIVPGVVNNPRLFYLPGSPTIFFAPFHHNSGPGVPSGFIMLQIDVVP